MFSQKCRPKNFDELSFNHDLTNKLQNIGLNNYIIYGGSGKLTRVYCHLAHNYNENIYKVKTNTYNLNKNITIIYKASNYHIEVNPSDYATNDKLVISTFLNELSTMSNIITNSVKTYVIKDADKLSIKAQIILKNLIESTYKTARFILICSNVDKLTNALKSRCYLFRCSHPTREEVSQILKDIGVKSGVKTSTRAINIIIENSKKLNGIISLNHAINIFQMSYLTGKYLRYDNNFTYYMDKLIDLINKSKLLELNDINKIREIIYIIYVSNLDISIVIKYMTINMIKDDISDEEKCRLMILAAKYECMMQDGNKEPLYLESFILNILSSEESIIKEQKKESIIKEQKKESIIKEGKNIQKKPVAKKKIKNI